MSKKLKDKIEMQSIEIAKLKGANQSLRSLLAVTVDHVEDPKTGIFECIGIAIAGSEKLCNQIVLK